MDLKVVLVVVCLTLLAITSTNGIPKCCIKTKDIHPKILRKIKCCQVQSSAGACDIDALVVYVTGQKKPFCAHPKWEKPLKKLLGLRKTKKQQNPWKC